ncbi:MAG: zf-HC2 domain-containing protein, partial [candidate division WOR-3 bacterium]
MKCSEVRRLLSSFADGELAAGLRADIENHLAGCAECGKELAELGAVVELLRAAPVPEPSPY